MNFEKRGVTRPADANQRADLTQRLLDVLSSIDQTKEEAKAAASEFRGIIADLHKREIGLRFNLQTGTVTQEIDVKAVINEATGFTEYYDRNGIEVPELRHETSNKEKEQDALQRQMDLFSKEDKGVNSFPVGDLPDLMTTEGAFVLNYETLQYERVNDDSAQPETNIAELQRETGTDQSDSPADVVENDVTAVQAESTTPTNVDIITEEIGQKIAEAVNGRIIRSEEDLQSETFDPASLDQLQTQAEAAGQLPPKPEKKSKKKVTNPEPAMEPGNTTK